MYDRKKAINELITAIIDEVKKMTDEEIMQELEDRDISYLFETE
jgi:arginine repressor